MASHYGHQAGWQQDQRRQEIDALIYAAKQAGTHEQIVYWSAEELIRSSPSRADGLDPATEAVWRRSYVCMISEVGAKLKIPMWNICVAVQFCHRFFAVKSMVKNDRFTVAIACLFLAAKANESPKPLQQVITLFHTQRWVKDRLMLAKLKDAEYMEQLRQSVMLAERGVLYALGFGLHAYGGEKSHPYCWLLDRLRRLGILNGAGQAAAGGGGEREKNMTQLMQVAWELLNDSLRTTLCLQHPPQVIASACLYAASALSGIRIPLAAYAQQQQQQQLLAAAPGQPPRPPPGALVSVWDALGIRPHHVSDVVTQIFDCWEAARREPQGIAPPPPVTPPRLEVLLNDGTLRLSRQANGRLVVGVKSEEEVEKEEEAEQQQQQQQQPAAAAAAAGPGSSGQQQQEAAPEPQQTLADAAAEGAGGVVGVKRPRSPEAEQKLGPADGGGGEVPAAAGGADAAVASKAARLG